MTSWLLALHMSARYARRNRARSALVVALILLPVAAMSFVVAALDMARLTPGEQVGREMGTADALVRWVSSGPVQQDVRGDSYLPVTGHPPARVSTADVVSTVAGATHASPYWRYPIAARGSGPARTVTGLGLDLTDAVTRGIARVLRGRAPTRPAEVAVTEAASRTLGVRLGDHLSATGGSGPYTIVAIVDVSADLGADLVFRPDQRPSPATTEDTAISGWLVWTRTPVTWAEARELNARGIVVESRDLWLRPGSARSDQDATTVTPATTIRLGVLAIGMALLEVVLLAGPAFAIGARRRQRDLALLAASGGAPRDLRRAVLADGAVLGLAAAVLGTAVGTGAAFVGRPVLESVSGARYGGYRTNGIELVAAGAVAVVTGLLGALAPAIAASRRDISASLRNRSGTTRVRKGITAAGLLMIGIGVVVTLVATRRVRTDGILLGLVVAQLGIVACTPEIVGLVARLGGIAPLTLRIALREASRRRGTAAAAASAVLAAVAGSLAITAYLGASEAVARAGYEPALPIGSIIITPTDPSPDRIRATVERLVPGTTTTPVDVVTCRSADGCSVVPILPASLRCPYGTEGGLSPADQRSARQDPRCRDEHSGYGPSTGLLVADSTTAVHAIIGATGTHLDQAVATLRSGGVLVGDPRYLTAGRVTTMLTGGTKPQITVPGYAIGIGIRPVLMSPGAARAAGFAVTHGGSVILTPPASAGATARDVLITALRPLAAPHGLYVEAGPPAPREGTSVILAIVAAVVALGATAIAVGLSAADSRAEVTTLVSVGAGPGVQRALAVWRAGVVAGLGGILGVVAGLGSVMGVLHALNVEGTRSWPAPPPYPLTIPWTNVGLAAVAVPAVAMAGAAILTRTAWYPARRSE